MEKCSELVELIDVLTLNRERQSSSYRGGSSHRRQLQSNVNCCYLSIHLFSFKSTPYISIFVSVYCYHFQTLSCMLLLFILSSLNLPHRIPDPTAPIPQLIAHINIDRAIRSEDSIDHSLLAFPISISKCFGLTVEEFPERLEEVEDVADVFLRVAGLYAREPPDRGVGGVADADGGVDPGVEARGAMFDAVAEEAGPWEGRVVLVSGRGEKGAGQTADRGVDLHVGRYRCEGVLVGFGVGCVAAVAVLCRDVVDVGQCKESLCHGWRVVVGYLGEEAGVIAWWIDEFIQVCFVSYFAEDDTDVVCSEKRGEASIMQGREKIWRNEEVIGAGTKSVVGQS